MAIPTKRDPSDIQYEKDNPEEYQLGSVNAALEQKMRMQSQIGTKAYLDIVRDEQDISRLNAALKVQEFNKGLSTPTSQYKHWHQANKQWEAQLGADLSGEIAALTKKKEALSQGALHRRIGRVKQQEQSALGQLDASNVQFGQAIDSNLNSLLEETGYVAGQARSGVGAGLASHGMSRSTIGSEAINDVTLKEFDEKGRIRQNALNARQDVARNISDVKKGISERREKLTANRNLAELQQAGDMDFEANAQRIRDTFEQQIANMKGDSSFKEDILASVGGLVGGGIKLFSSMGKGG